MITYKVSFQINQPIIMNYQGIMFDALIMKEWLRITGKDTGAGLKYIPTDQLINITDLDLFAKNEHGLVYASRLLHEDAFWDTMFWCKRFNVKRALQFSDLQGNVNVQKGRFKSYKEKLSTLNTNEAWFYFAVDNDNQYDRIAQCLKRIRFLGKKTSTGNGECELIGISEASDDVWKEIIRPIPMRMIQDKEKVTHISYVNWQPPYWQSNNQELCAVEGTL